MVSPAPALLGRLATLNSAISRAAANAGRPPDSVQLVAVSKGHPARAIGEAWEYGQRLFGESYVQEWTEKAEDAELLGRRDLAWTFIGHLQRNKVRFLLGRVACIETVDSARLAAEISARAASRGGAFRQRVLLQVCTGDEAGKSGFQATALGEALGDLAALPGLQIEGLMHIPPWRSDPEATRADHRSLRALRDGLQDRWGVALPELSMGMSDDFAVAIAEGATRVRVGTALFGPRAPRG